MAIDKSKEAMKLALEALESLKVTVSSRTEANVIDGVDLFPKQMAALQKALANEALDRMAENARELGLDYKTAQHEPVAWRNVALRVGEDLCSVGPFGYYDMTAEQWLDWALSVVTVHAPPAQRTWVGLTDEVIWLEYQRFWPFHPAEEPTLAKDIAKFALAIEAKLKEKNT